MEKRLKIRVYYEDTDFSGRVYHASYLRFMERARTEWLRARGFENLHLAHHAALSFVVREVKLEYLAAAVMDDLLSVTARVSRVRGALLDFEQEVFREHELLCKGVIGVVTLRGTKPVRPPRELIGASVAPLETPI
jgi:acyl-CoA thioester hydrolase